MNELQYWALQHQATVDIAQPSVKYFLNRKQCAHQALSMHFINLNIIAYTRSRSYRASFDEKSPPLATLAHLPSNYIPLLRSIMRRNTPFRYWNTWRRNEIASRHTVPLGVQ
jgi:hypothetical protein